MSRAVVRRHRAALLALLCVGICTAFVLLALDIRTWQTTVSRDDLRFRALPAHVGLWQPATILPGDPASQLLGTSATVRYRQALQYFWFSRIGDNPEVRQDLPTLRAAAQQRLEDLVSSAPRQADRSTIANLLGVLVVTTPAQGGDQQTIAQTLKRATAYFQQAIAIDPDDVDAKQNLELILRLQKPGKGRLGRDARSGYGFGKGNAASPIGGGY